VFLANELLNIITQIKLAMAMEAKAKPIIKLNNLLCIILVFCVKIKSMFKQKITLLVAALLLVAFLLVGCAIPVPSKIPIPKWPLF